MKKLKIGFVSIALVVGFGILVYYGFEYSRGVAVAEEPKEKIILEVPYMDKTIDLSQGISPEIWDKLPSKEIELRYQTLVLPWGRNLGSPITVTVKAFHNKEDIYFYISWKDESENITIGPTKFSDAAAIMFPIGDEVLPTTIMMGLLGKVNIWHWKASQDREYWQKASSMDQGEKAYSDFYYPFEETEVLTVSKEIPKSAVSDLIAMGVGTLTPKEKQIVQGRGFYDRGRWHVVFKRSIQAEDGELDAQFNIGGKKPCAFAVWNGENGDRGSRKLISDWVYLEIK